MWTLELANSIVVFVGVHTGVRALWMVIAILGPRLRGRNDRSEKELPAEGQPLFLVFGHCRKGRSPIDLYQIAHPGSKIRSRGPFLHQIFF